MNLRATILAFLPCWALILCGLQPLPTPRENPAQAALEEFQDLIGGWRGVGQPVRGSARGAWQETADWAWSFEEKQPALVYSIKEGNLLSSARLTFNPEEKQFRLQAIYADESEREFRGTLEKKKLEMVSGEDAAGERHRITITRLNEKRTLVLVERSIAPDRYFRIAEVGYTREGTRLAVAGADGPECVVTGGKATMPVMHEGKTYYVCCTGCRQAFEDDPTGILAEYEAKVAARKSQSDR
jgi:YHS domain-containing protein